MLRLSPRVCALITEPAHHHINEVCNRLTETASACMTMASLPACCSCLEDALAAACTRLSENSTPLHVGTTRKLLARAPLLLQGPAPLEHKEA